MWPSEGFGTVQSPVGPGLGSNLSTEYRERRAYNLVTIASLVILSFKAITSQETRHFSQN